MENYDAVNDVDTEYEEYRKVYQVFDEDNDAGFLQLLELAENGNVYAQYSVGHCYLGGKGVEEDRAKAFEWWLKAAENGHEQSQINVAAGYWKGEAGLEKSFDKGVEWMKKAAYAGNLDAVQGLCIFGIKP